MKKLFILVLFLASSCTTSSSDVLILSESTCELPCWYNVVPGETTKEEYIQYIEDIPTNGLQPSINVIDGTTLTLFDGVVTYKVESGWFLNRRLEFWIQAWWTSDNIIRYVDMCSDEDLNTTISDLINKTGEPEFIISGGNRLGGKDIILINSLKGISYWYQTNQQIQNIETNISPDIKIRCLEIFDTKMYGDLMEVGLFSMGFYNTEETLKVMYPWDGYGNLDEKYPPRQP